MPLVPDHIWDAPTLLPGSSSLANGKEKYEDYNKFGADGCVTSQQKCYHNVIHEKLLDIDLEKGNKLSTHFLA